MPIKKRNASEVDAHILGNSTVRADSSIARMARKLEQERNEAREQARWAMTRLHAAATRLKLDGITHQIDDRMQAFPDIFNP